MQDKDGGYCPTCDTVWASPGKCKCDGPSFKEFNNKITMTVKGNCGVIHTFEEWQKCRACGPVSDEVKNNDSWNAAIEAAAELMDEMGEEERITIYVRKLKK